MRDVGIQRMHQRRPFLNDPDPRVAVTVDPPLVALGQAKPTLQIEIILDLFIHAVADEKAGEKAEHHRRHVVPNRILGLLELIDQLLELLLSLRAIRGPRFEGRRQLRDDRDVVSDDLLLLRDCVQTAFDASEQAAELRFREPPFFSSKFRWIDAPTSCNASAIRKPGGSSGPPWSSLRMPRTAVQ